MKLSCLVKCMNDDLDASSLSKASRGIRRLTEIRRKITKSRDFCGDEWSKYRSEYDSLALFWQRGHE